jgi:hypothetical protein
MIAETIIAVTASVTVMIAVAVMISIAVLVPEITAITVPVAVTAPLIVVTVAKPVAMELVPAALTLVVQVTPPVIRLSAVVSVVFDGIPESGFCPLNSKLARSSVLSLHAGHSNQKTDCAQSCSQGYSFPEFCKVYLCVQGFSYSAHTCHTC